MPTGRDDVRFRGKTGSNLPTAKALGLDVPLQLQQLANEVIE